MQATATSTATLRSELGDFASIICFKALTKGIEAALGEKTAAVAITAAGRQRGKDLVKSLGLSGQATALDDAAAKMRAALGPDGTKLCIVDRIESTDDYIFAYIREDICTAGETASDRKCVFTLGAIWGALEELTGKRLRGQHTESVLTGASANKFEFQVLG